MRCGGIITSIRVPVHGASSIHSVTHGKEKSGTILGLGSPPASSSVGSASSCSAGVRLSCNGKTAENVIHGSSTLVSGPTSPVLSCSFVGHPGLVSTTGPGNGYTPLVP